MNVYEDNKLIWMGTYKKPYKGMNGYELNWYQSRGHGFEPQGCRWGRDCWQIGGLAMSINSPCVRRGNLGECTIRLEYTSFLQAIAFRRVGSAWGPTVHTLYLGSFFQNSFGVFHRKHKKQKHTPFPKQVFCIFCFQE